MKSFHKSNFGKFGDNLPCDLDGYVHTTIKAWMAAKVDEGSSSTSIDKYEWAKAKVEETRKAIKEAEDLLETWGE